MQAKRFFYLVVLPFSLCFSLTLLVDGCQKKTAPLPKNAVTSLDGTFNADLQAAHAAIVQYETDVKAGVHKATPEEKAAVNVLIRAVNVAQPLEIAYHQALLSNPALVPPAELNAAMSNVQTAATSLQSSLTGKAK